MMRGAVRARFPICTGSDMSRLLATAVATMSEQFVRLEGFEQIITRAQFGGFDGRLGRAMRRHQDDRLFGFRGVQLRHQFQSPQARHPQIRDDNVVRLALWLAPTPRRPGAQTATS